MAGDHGRAQGLVFPAQLAHFQRMLDKQEDLFQRQGLFDEIMRPAPQRAHGGFNIAVAGNHDHGHIRKAQLEQIQRLHPVHARQPDIEKDHVGRGGFGLLQPFLGGGSLFHRIALIFKYAAQ